VYLGADLPAEELARAVTAREATVVALSMVYPPGEARIAAELRKLRTLLPEVTIVVGGASAGSYSATLSEIGAVRLAELSALRSVLADLVPDRISLLA
jgi:hypothetical protein